MANYRRVVGIDPSVKGTGTATITVGSPYSTTYHPITNYDAWETFAKLSKIVAERVCDADLVVLEKNLEMAKTFRTSIVLGKVNAIIGLTLWQLKKPYIIVAPIQLRSFVGDIPKGKKAKDVMSGLDHLNYDEVDALVLAMIGACKSGIMEPEGRHRALLSRLKIQYPHPV